MGLGTVRLTRLATAVRGTVLGLALGTLAVLAFPGAAGAQPPKGQPKTKTGLLVNEPKASPGYTLVAP